MRGRLLCDWRQTDWVETQETWYAPSSVPYPQSWRSTIVSKPLWLWLPLFTSSEWPMRNKFCKQVSNRRPPARGPPLLNWGALPTRNKRTGAGFPVILQATSGKTMAYYCLRPTNRAIPAQSTRLSIDLPVDTPPVPTKGDQQIDSSLVFSNSSANIYCKLIDNTKQEVRAIDNTRAELEQTTEPKRGIESDAVDTREHWSSRAAFYFAAVGSAVGYGNV
ncbi:hypothetical protein THAOC_02225 [Thalassiosira oceanica]|uniref:Uncharacterized protein n=1 Tax=Thalassiosira oceanica TaxID=159749 RepID=K0TG58_THAOC|nr:hypothetical protein THAOC_02225 [Thalassiosira oceanica]|eukprot:EJK76034.1 hypothetical protein THAOC_02225 [Thalassiosira oceanica]